VASYRNSLTIPPPKGRGEGGGREGGGRGREGGREGGKVGRRESDMQNSQRRLIEIQRNDPCLLMAHGDGVTRQHAKTCHYSFIYIYIYI